MSLITDKVFYNALKSNPDLVAMVGGRIENTAITVPEEELLNQPVPFIIIAYDDMQNEKLTKDESYEGDKDQVYIRIDVRASDRETLGDICITIRQTVRDYFENAVESQPDYALVPLDYEFEAGSVKYNPWVPLFAQSLTYICETNTD
jgi:hypothetical protein